MKIIVFILAIFCFTNVSAQEMKIHIPELKLRQEDGRYILYENTISSDKALLFFQQLESNGVFSPDFYRIPNPDNFYFVAAEIKGNKELSYPLKAFLFEELQTDLVERFRSINLTEFRSFELKPIFFIGEKSVLILAEKNYLGFRGIEAFEFKEKQLKYLGSFTVAYKSGKKNAYTIENPLKLHYKANSAEKVKVTYQKDFYQIELKGEFYEYMDDSIGKKISSKNSTVIYKLDKNGFQLLEVKSTKKRTQK
ncbi:MAG TPA: hypothetical protein PKE69_05015 [Pyrinomonadaceae bacterium]|nr:hypothetical protein [Pyrinomonadaceae bacterium]